MRYVVTVSRSPGLLLLRFGLGALIIAFSAWPDLSAGTERWTEIGQSLSVFGVKSYADLWGLGVVCTEMTSAVCLVLGLFTRLSAFCLALIMAASTAISATPESVVQALQGTIVFLGLALTGAGRFSLDQKIAEGQSL